MREQILMNMWTESPTEWVIKEREKLKTASYDISLMSRGEKSGSLERVVGSRNTGWKKL